MIDCINMSRQSAIKSILSNDSGDTSDILLELGKSNIDQKSFLSLLTAIDQKCVNESVQIPKEGMKRLQKSVKNLFDALLTRNQASEYLIMENCSLLSVYVRTLIQDPLAAKKKNDLINTIKDLFRRLNDSLITDMVEFSAFRRFIMILIKILEIFADKSDDKTKELICSSVSTLLYKASETFHSYYFELINEEEDVSRHRMSLFMSIGNDKNLVNLALTCLVKVFPHSDCKSVKIIEEVFKYLSNLVERHDSAEGTYIVIMKNLNLITEVLAKFQEKKGKPYKELSIIERPLQHIWKWLIQKFIAFNTEDPIDYLAKDQRQLSQMFINLRKLLNRYLSNDNKYTIKDYIEKFPIELFTCCLKSLNCENSQQLTNKLQIQLYMLEFCVEFYAPFAKFVTDDHKYSLKESGLIGFLLSKEVFGITAAGNNLAQRARLHWKTLWAFLSCNKLNIRQMVEEFVGGIVDNFDQIGYTTRCIEWLSELQSESSPFLPDAVQEKLVATMLVGLKDLLRSHPISDLSLYTSILLSTLDLKSVQDHEKSKILHLIDSPDLMLSLLPVVEKLLTLASYENHLIFKETLKKISDWKVLISLFQVLYKAFESSSLTQKNFLNTGILIVIKTKVNPELIQSKELLIDFWKILIKCARSLFLSIDVTKKNIEDFDFNSISEYLTHRNLRHHIDQIAEGILEDVEFMLYKTKSLQESNKIILPQVTPLLFQVLTSGMNRPRFREAELRIERILYKDSELLYLATFNALDVILKYFSISTELNISDFFEKVLAKIIPIHIPPQGLSQLLNIIRFTTNPNKKKILMQALKQAISKSESRDKFLTPSKYFYIEPFTGLSGEGNFDLNTSGKVTVALWFRAKKTDISCSIIRSYSFNHYWICIELKNKNLIIRVAENVFTLKDPIEDNTWHFICVSIRNKKKALRSTSIVSICLNEKVLEVDLGSDKFESKIFTKLIIGNPKDLNSERASQETGFEGRLSSIFIIFKSLSESEIHELRRAFIESNLNLSTSSLKSDEFKVLKDIKKSSVFEWRPSVREPIFPWKLTSLVDTSKRFTGVSLFEAIKLNGGLKIFLPLMDLENQNRDEIISVTSIILSVFINTQSPEYLTQEFVQLAGHVIISVNLFPELTNNLIKIVTSLKNTELRTKLMKLLLLNETIDQIPSEEKMTHMINLIPLFKEHISCDRENLFMIYRHIKRQNPLKVFEVLNSFIPEKLSSINKDAICFIIVQMCKDKYDTSIEALLNLLISRVEGMTIDNNLEAGLIYLLDQTDLVYKSHVVKILLKDIEKFSEKKPNDNSAEVERYVKIIRFLDHKLESKGVDHTVIQSVFEVVSNPMVPTRVVVHLLDIITNRISHSAQKDHEFLFYLALIEQHIMQLLKFIYQSNFFPDWLSLTVRNAKNKMDLLSLCNSVFLPPDDNFAKFSNLAKFVRQVMSEKEEDSSRFIMKLVKKLGEDYMDTKAILRPEYYAEFLKVVDEVEIVSDMVSDYYDLISKTQQFGLGYSIITLNSSILDSSSSKLKSAARDSKDSSPIKLLISLIFKGLSSTSNSDFLIILNSLLDHFNYFSTPKNEKKLSSEDVLLIEIFTQLSEVYLRSPDELWLESFIQKTSIISKIGIYLDTFQESELRSRIYGPESQKASMRSTTLDIDDRINSSVASESLQRRKTSQDGTSLKSLIASLVKPEEVFPKFMKNEDWQNIVHAALVSIFEIRRLPTRSFDLSIAGKDLRSSSFQDLAVKTKEFIKKYDDDWIKNFNETRSLAKLHIAKKYKAYLRNLKRLKAVLTSGKEQKYKLRPYFDDKQRQCLTKSCNPKDYSSHSLPLTKSPTRQFNRSYSTAYYESFHEKSGEVCSPLIEENEVENENEYEYENEFSEGEINAFEEEPENFTQQVSNTQIIECERITIKGSYFGSLEIHGPHLVYISEGKPKQENKYPFSALEFTHQKKECKRIWDNSEISEIICRRFLHQHTALEIYLKSGKSYLFNVFHKEIRDSLFKSMSSWKKTVRLISEITPKTVKSYTKKWLENKIDNFEYILTLNRLASRSFHDLSQYPVFPWVIKDFTSDKLDPANPEIYRNLAFPVGSQEEKRRDEMKKNFDQFQNEGISPFHHGSHYSNGGIVLHYLVRIEPFAYQARLLQNNTFDVPDRLFINMDNAWKSCLSNGGDVKELIPELYYLADALFNVNKYDFGRRQGGQPVGDFEYPPWAKSNWDFIRKHRKCLESQYVTENLHSWIDLIFGFKQSGPEALKAFNVFHAYTYEKDFEIACKSGIDEGIQRGIIEQAYHFGQTPVMLFPKQHPVKKYDKNVKISVFERYFKLVEDKKATEIKEMTCFEEPGPIFALIPTSSHLFAVKRDNDSCKYFLIRLKWESFNEFGQRNESYELEGFNVINLDSWTEYQSWRSTLPKFNLGFILDIGQSQFAVWEDKFLVSCFHFDDTFKINSSKGELKRSIRYHCGLVTCVYTTNKTLFTGGIDSAVIAWKGSECNIDIYNIYLGHNSSIKQIQASESFQIVISLSASGMILEHDLRNAECLRKIADPNAKPARIIALSELGIVAVAFMEKEFIGMFSINGSYWDDSRPAAEDVWCMVFNKTGEFLVTGSNKSIAFFDILNKGPGLENLMYSTVNNTILAVAVSKDEEFIVYAINKKNKCAMCCVKIENKNEKQSVIDTIRQFA